MTMDNERYVNYLNPPIPAWKRPDTEKRVWRVINGRRKTSSDEIPRFSIQEIPADLEDDVIDFLVEYFIPEEPISVDTGLASDPVAVSEFRTMWRSALDQGISIVALMLHSDPTAKPVIAAVNVLCVTSAEDKCDPESVQRFRSKPMKRMLELCTKMNEEADVIRRYGVDKFLGSFGLSVHPSFRGQGLGEELLRTRHDVGRAYQLPVTYTAFSANVSQLLAARVGYEVLIEKKYSEFLDDEGNVAFPGLTTQFVKAMGKRLY